MTYFCVEWGVKPQLSQSVNPTVLRPQRMIMCVDTGRLNDVITMPPSYHCACVISLSVIEFLVDEALHLFATFPVPVSEPLPENWRRPPGRPHTTWMKNIHDDLSSRDLGIREARDLVQNRPLCRLMSLHSAMHS